MKSVEFRNEDAMAEMKMGKNCSGMILFLLISEAKNRESRWSEGSTYTFTVRQG